MKILVLNAGSSSQKCSLYTDNHPEPLWTGAIDWNHQPGRAELIVKTAQQQFSETVPLRDRLTVIARLLSTLWQGETQVIQDAQEIDAVGHRVVHGGDQYRESVRITAEVKAAIATLAQFAPVHNPVNLEGIDAIEKILGTTIAQVAVFDTAFHAQIPPAAYVYPGPYEWLAQGIRRYGFHGISHQYCAQRTAQLMGRDLNELRLIICHLGNGCSIAAIREGHSIDTTMGFTPLEGLMMGSRSGSIDPGILIHLLRQGVTPDELDQTLNKASGLLGISGVSSDFRSVLEAIQKGDSRSQLALDIYVHRIRAAIAAMLPQLGGVDALIFTAGVGENAAIVRSQVCAAFAFLGWQIDENNNQASPVDHNIATPESTAPIYIIKTQEDWAIAQDCWRLLSD
jgi:acetate kinase